MNESHGPSEKLVILVVNDSLAQSMGSNGWVHASISVPMGHAVADVTLAVRRALYPDDETESAVQPGPLQKGQEDADCITPARSILRKGSLVSWPLSREVTAESPSSILMTPRFSHLGSTLGSSPSVVNMTPRPSILGSSARQATLSRAGIQGSAGSDGPAPAPLSTLKGAGSGVTGFSWDGQPPRSSPFAPISPPAHDPLSFSSTLLSLPPPRGPRFFSSQSPSRPPPPPPPPSLSRTSSFRVPRDTDDPLNNLASLASAPVADLAVNHDFYSLSDDESFSRPMRSDENTLDLNSQFWFGSADGYSGREDDPVVEQEEDGAFGDGHDAGPVIDVDNRDKAAFMEPSVFSMATSASASGQAPTLTSAPASGPAPTSTSVRSIAGPGLGHSASATSGPESLPLDPAKSAAAADLGKIKLIDAPAASAPRLWELVQAASGAEVGQAVAAVEEIFGLSAVAARTSGGAPAVQARLALATALEGLQATHPTLVLMNSASPASAISPSTIGAKHAGWQRAAANIQYASSTFEKDRAKLAIARMLHGLVHEPAEDPAGRRPDHAAQLLTRVPVYVKVSSEHSPCFDRLDQKARSAIETAIAPLYAEAGAKWDAFLSRVGDGWTVADALASARG